MKVNLVGVWISSTASLASTAGTAAPGPHSRVAASWASALRPALASQRGDSGTQSKAPSWAMHGRMATANIFRQ